MAKKRVDLAYGRNGLTITVPDYAEVVLPRPVAGVADEPATIDAALSAPIGAPPLADLAAGKRRVVVTHSDITRATPNDRILPVLLRALEAAGVARRDITLLNALVTHRRQTVAELRRMLGAGVVERYRCEQHDAWDDAALVAAGTTSRGNATLEELRPERLDTIDSRAPASMRSRSTSPTRRRTLSTMAPAAASRSGITRQ